MCQACFSVLRKHSSLCARTKFPFICPASLQVGKNISIHVGTHINSGHHSTYFRIQLGQPVYAWMQDRVRSLKVKSFINLVQFCEVPQCGKLLGEESCDPHEGTIRLMNSSIRCGFPACDFICHRILNSRWKCRVYIMSHAIDLLQSIELGPKLIRQDGYCTCFFHWTPCWGLLHHLLRMQLRTFQAHGWISLVRNPVSKKKQMCADVISYRTNYLAFFDDCAAGNVGSFGSKG